MEPSLFLGVDVGTGSARAGVFDESGKLLGWSSSPLQIWHSLGCVEQSSTDIWLAVCNAVDGACRNSGAKRSWIRGIGFCATCSLVAIGPDNEPVSVSWSGDTRRNVIVWMDHRAVEQAERINDTKSDVLKYVGGKISPEMQPAKLLWVKENLPNSWGLAFKWMDLADWLTYRATGDDTRSLCTTVCKWLYSGQSHIHKAESGKQAFTGAMAASGWQDAFLKQIGLGDLTERNHLKIGRWVGFPGHACAGGLTREAAMELGLTEGTPVSISMIDAHAGALGCLEGVPLDPQFEELTLDTPLDTPPSTSTPPSKRWTGLTRSAAANALAKVDGNGNGAQANVEESARRVSGSSARSSSGEEVEVGPVREIARRVVMVCGTSTCHMFTSEKEIFVPGVWGPYWSVVVPGLWLTEGGQSATGSLLDHILDNHPATTSLRRQTSPGVTVFELLNRRLDELVADLAPPFRAALTEDTHVLPYFHGNRTPHANPLATGMLTGLTLSTDEGHLARLYLATVQALAYETRHIIDHCNAHGHQVDTIVACGGLAKNRVFLQEHADITGCVVVLPRESEPVLLGAAVLGSVAAGHFASIREAMTALNAPGQVIRPSGDSRLRKYHEAKYKIFHEMYTHQQHYRSTIQEALTS